MLALEILHTIFQARTHRRVTIAQCTSLTVVLVGLPTKRFYQKIRDIYALAVDYDPSADETQIFFRVVQNKLHFAVSGKTAAELIAERADASKPNMGLTAWKGEVVRKGDVAVAKNYLAQEEMTALNRIVTM